MGSGLGVVDDPTLPSAGWDGSPFVGVRMEE